MMDDTTRLDGDRPLGLVRRLWSNRRLRTVGLGVVVVLVATTGWLLWRDDRPTATVPEVAGQATSPAEAGLGFLTALSQGRAADVAAYLRADPGVASLSDAVLSASAQINPITDIVVLDAEQQRDEGTVTMQYQFGDQRVIDTYEVVRHGGSWKLADVAEADSITEAPGYVEITWAAGAVRDQLTINDVAIPADEPLLLYPGTYRVGSTNPLLTSDEVLVVPALSTSVNAITKGPRHSYLPSLTLTDAGQQQVTQAVQTTIDTCLQEAALTTSCGLRFSSIYLGGRTPVESSLRWSVDPASIDMTSTRPMIVGQAQVDPTTDELVPGLWAYWHGGDFGSVTASGSVQLTNGEIQVYDDTLYYYAVDLSDPDHPAVFLSWLSSGSDARGSS